MYSSKNIDHKTNAISLEGLSTSVLPIAWEWQKPRVGC